MIGERRRIMKTIPIKLNSVLEIQKFITILDKYSSDFDLRCGHSIVDAKSILGILSLDLSRTLVLTVYEEEKTLFKDLIPFRKTENMNPKTLYTDTIAV